MLVSVMCKPRVNLSYIFYYSFQVINLCTKLLKSAFFEMPKVELELL